MVRFSLLTKMAKIDLKQELKDLYFPSTKEVVMIDVPDMNFLMVDGKGNPNTSKDFQDALGALYPVAYTLKFRFKNSSNKTDFAVMPPEALWWSGGKEMLDLQSKENWEWTIMIMQPNFVTKDLVVETIEQIKLKKKKETPVALSKVQFKKYHEGRSAQIMYIGPYADEGPTIMKIHEFIKEAGYRPLGKHHEIYLGDPRRAKPEKLKTVIRQPMKK